MTIAKCTTLCRKGLHDLTLQDAVYLSSNGKRRCRECALIRNREHKRKKAAETHCSAGHPWAENARWVRGNGTRYRRCITCEKMRAMSTNKHIADALASRRHGDVTSRLMELAVAREIAMPWERAAYEAESRRLQNPREASA